MVESSSKGSDHDADCLMDSSKTSKWCVPFTNDRPWCKIRFQKPIEIHYYTMTLANDFPGRDPTKWSVELVSEFRKYKEIHNSQMS